MSDTATIVSIFPLEVKEFKPFTEGYFRIPPAEKGEVQAVIVKTNSFSVYIDEHRGALKVPVTADEVARSVVEDYISTHLGYSEDAKPGLFWVPGAFTKDQIKAQFKDKLAQAEKLQINWFVELVRLADDSWGVYHKHNAISDLMRIAAERLGLQREWMIKASGDNTIVCPACGKDNLRGIAICFNCKCILDESKAKSLKFAGA